MAGFLGAVLALLGRCGYHMTDGPGMERDFTVDFKGTWYCEDVGRTLVFTNETLTIADEDGILWQGEWQTCIDEANVRKAVPPADEALGDYFCIEQRPLAEANPDVRRLVQLIGLSDSREDVYDFRSEEQRVLSE